MKYALTTVKGKKNMLVSSAKVFVLSMFFVGTSQVLHAAGFTNPLGNVTLYDFLLGILNSLIFILFPVIVLMIVITGFLFVVAQGNATKLQTARSSLLWTVIGGLIILGSKGLALAIEATVQNIVP
jgi:hypothetical protein